MVYPYDLTVKKACFNPLKWDRCYLSKKRLDVSFKHAIDLIRVKIVIKDYLIENEVIK